MARRGDIAWSAQPRQRSLSFLAGARPVATIRPVTTDDLGACTRSRTRTSRTRPATAAGSTGCAPACSAPTTASSSTAGIVVGVAGATTDRSAILIAGVAGLAAGALSMAAGEYVSVSTQRDSELALLDKERIELRDEPTEELEELAGIYVGKGLTEDLALQVARQLTEPTTPWPRTPRPSWASTPTTSPARGPRPSPR